MTSNASTTSCEPVVEAEFDDAALAWFNNKYVTIGEDFAESGLARMREMLEYMNSDQFTRDYAAYIERESEWRAWQYRRMVEAINAEE
jgi:hypothetical protein